MKRRNIGFSTLLCVYGVLLFMVLLPVPQIDVSYHNGAPSWSHWLGTDELGRDIMLRLLRGTGMSMGVVGVSLIIDMGIAFAYSYLSTLFHRSDFLYALDLCSAVPSLLFPFLLAAVLPPSPLSLSLSLAVAGWVPMARILHIHMQELYRCDYVQAAVGLGATSSRVFYRYLLPQSGQVLRSTVLMGIGKGLGLEAFLSFLGLGLQPPDVSLGILIGEGWAVVSFDPLRLIVPLVWVTVLAVGWTCRHD